MESDTICAIQEDKDRSPLRGSHLFVSANPGFRYASASTPTGNNGPSGTPAWASLVLALRAAFGIRGERMIHFCAVSEK